MDWPKRETNDCLFISVVQRYVFVLCFDPWFGKLSSKESRVENDDGGVEKEFFLPRTDMKHDRVRGDDTDFSQ